MTVIAPDPRMQIDTGLHHRSPGMVLRDDYVQPRGLHADDLAELSGIPAWDLRRIMLGTSIFADEALQLTAALNTSAIYWLMLQACYDLERAMRDAAQDGGAKYSQAYYSTLGE